MPEIRINNPLEEITNSLLKSLSITCSELDFEKQDQTYLATIKAPGNISPVDVANKLNSFSAYRPKRIEFTKNYLKAWFPFYEYNLGILVLFSQQ